jgi:hypothetical protein
MKYSIALVGLIEAKRLSSYEYPQPDIRGPMPRNAHPDSTFSSHLHNDWTLTQMNEYPQPDIRGPMPRNAHPDSTFSSHLHNDWTLAQIRGREYPQPDIRGPMPRNAHPDSTFSSHLHNDWTLSQLKEYPQPDIRGPMPRNAHPDSTFSSHLHNDWTLAQLQEYPQPDIRGPMPRNAHPDSTFSSHLHNDWTLLQTEDFEHFPATFDGMDGSYDRQIPARFSEMRDDRLMASLIKNYALEQKTADGKPSGNFFFDRDAARAASKEVITTHMNLDKISRNKYLEENFDSTWTHFDVNNDNLIEVERMPQFLRYLLGNSLEFGL